MEPESVLSSVHSAELFLHARVLLTFSNSYFTWFCIDEGAINSLEWQLTMILIVPQKKKNDTMKRKYSVENEICIEFSLSSKEGGLWGGWLREPRKKPSLTTWGLITMLHVRGWVLTTEDCLLMSTSEPYKTHTHMYTHRQLINKTNT